MRSIVSLISGAMFGTGLVLSGMANPAKVQAFLDPLGAWDPTLAFVLGGAMLPMFFAWRLTRGGAPKLATAFPGMKREIDARLITGAALFGTGWGLGGYCPGPAIASLSFGGANALIATAAILAGMAAHRFAPDIRLSIGGRPRMA